MEDHAYLSLEDQTPYQFMQHRIHKILLVCCTYDGYILEEDGHIESQINREYLELKREADAKTEEWGELVG